MKAAFTLIQRPAKEPTIRSKTRRSNRPTIKIHKPLKPFTEIRAVGCQLNHPDWVRQADPIVLLKLCATVEFAARGSYKHYWEMLRETYCTAGRGRHTRFLVSLLRK